ncbi:hypothetical protein B0H13DRAFT_1968361 [Mycena leptocephala]|nr:hypothetical protein B0H13DRAFT_1968361 [Mycena leptocephala]
MDDVPQVEREVYSESLLDEGPQHDRFTGAFFPQAQRFVVVGGKFKSITNINHAAPRVPADFRRIPMGDVDLRSEICVDGDSGMVQRWHPGQPVRMYAARIHGSKSKMTVAMYEDQDAEEEWRQDMLRYSSMRHPNFVQLFGAASASGMHAAIFHDELIPARQLLKKYRGSHFSMVHLWAYFGTEYRDANRYIEFISGKHIPLYSQEGIIWIRPSTGRLCVDLEHRHGCESLGLFKILTESPSLPTLSQLEPPEDSNIIESIPLDLYHRICAWHLYQFRMFPVSTNVSVQLGAVIFCPGSEIEYSNEISCMPDIKIFNFGWWHNFRLEALSVVEGGWTRVNSSDIGNWGCFILEIQADVEQDGWLAQANHIFDRIGITSDYHDYVLIDQIRYFLQVYGPGNGIPPGYLFLCPLANTNQSRLRRPDCSAYWSLDPSGVERLSMEEAGHLGFPDLQMQVHARGWTFEESVYAGTRRFHHAKGFDPHTQDVARALGQQLWHISPQVDSPFAPLQEIPRTSEYDDVEHSEVRPTNECGQEVIHEESAAPSESLSTLRAKAISESCMPDGII